MDAATGRFLTRDARPNQNNPYTPIDPTSALLGPLALLTLAYGRKKSRGKWDTLVILLVLGKGGNGQRGDEPRRQRKIPFTKGDFRPGAIAPNHYELLQNRAASRSTPNFRYSFPNP